MLLSLPLLTLSRTRRIERQDLAHRVATSPRRTSRGRPHATGVRSELKDANCAAPAPQAAFYPEPG